MFRGLLWLFNFPPCSVRGEQEEKGVMRFGIFIQFPPLETLRAHFWVCLLRARLCSPNASARVHPGVGNFAGLRVTSVKEQILQQPAEGITPFFFVAILRGLGGGGMANQCLGPRRLNSH